MNKNNEKEKICLEELITELLDDSETFKHKLLYPNEQDNKVVPENIRYQYVYTKLGRKILRDSIVNFIQSHTAKAVEKELKKLSLVFDTLGRVEGHEIRKHCDFGFEEQTRLDNLAHQNRIKAYERSKLIIEDRLIELRKESNDHA